MPPTRAQTSAALSSYFQATQGDLQLASLLAFQAHLPSSSSSNSTSLNKSHAIELVLWVEDEVQQPDQDVRNKFSIASVELEPLEVVAQSFGGGKDIEGLRSMLLARGEKLGQVEEEGTEVYTVVVFAIYPRPPSPGSGEPSPSFFRSSRR